MRLPLSWPHARDLLLSEDSDAYRSALRCLVRIRDRQQVRRDNEWRPPGSPRITPVEDGVRMVFDAYTYVDERDLIRVGAWRIDVGHAYWTVRLEPPVALRTARWQRIEVDPGAPGAQAVSPRVTGGSGSTALVWEPSARVREPPDVSVRLAPDWARSWAAQSRELPFNDVDRGGYLVHDLSIAAAAWWLARYLRREPLLPPDEEDASRALEHWAQTAVVVALAVDGDDIVFQTLQGLWPGEGRNMALGLVGVALCPALATLLLVFAGTPARDARDVLVAAGAGAGVVAALGGLSALLTSAAYVVLWALVGIGWACLFTGMLGAVAAAGRLARDGRLPGIALPRLRRAVPWAAAAALVTMGCYLWTAESQWRRASWLSAHADPRYGERHADYLIDAVGWAGGSTQDWLFTWVQVLTVVGVLGVLRARARRPGAAPRGLEAPDRWLMLLLFTCGAGLFLGVYADNAALSPLWVALNAGALLVLTAAGRGRSVLAQRLERSRAPLAEVLGEGDRPRLIAAARRHREVHAMMRRLDSGQSDDGAHTRRGFERELRALHRLRGPSGTADRLPAKISTVDVALAWGPRETWWANGARAARLAAVLGLPASAFMVWAEMIRGEAWNTTTSDPFGGPGLVVGFAGWELRWVCLGFVLGALWRELPGRRGPARALPIALAFALPAGADAVLNHALSQGQGNIPLYVACALLVLTLTAVAMDLDTFRSERRYWNSRYSLLLSVYQLRYFSVQLAWVIAQVVALIGVWEFLSGGSGTPLKQVGNP